MQTWVFTAGKSDACMYAGQEVVEDGRTLHFDGPVRDAGHAAATGISLHAQSVRD